MTSIKPNIWFSYNHWVISIKRVFSRIFNNKHVFFEESFFAKGNIRKWLMNIKTITRLGPTIFIIFERY